MPPRWFKANEEKVMRWLAIVQHQDKKRSWPWYGRFQHWLFVSWRCPACKAEEEK